MKDITIKIYHAISNHTIYMLTFLAVFYNFLDCYRNVILGMKRLIIAELKEEKW